MKEKPTAASSPGQPPSTFLHRFVLGCSAGLISAALLQPLDLVKTKLQGQVLRTASAKNITDVSPRLAQGRNQGSVSLWQTVFHIWKVDGVKGFWRGTGPSVVRSSLGPGIYFCILEQMSALEHWKAPSQQDNARQPSVQFSIFFQAGFARLIAGTVMSPVTVIKTRYEWSSSRNPSIFSTLKHLVKTEGFKGLFAGLVPTLIRDVPQAGLYLFLYSHAKQYLASYSRTFDTNNSATVTVASAFGAGIVSTTITLPADVLKTQLQLRRQLVPAMVGERVGWRQSIDLLHLVLRKHGLPGLFSGISTRVIRKPLQMTITWSVYELLR